METLKLCKVQGSVIQSVKVISYDMQQLRPQVRRRHQPLRHLHVRGSPSLYCSSASAQILASLSCCVLPFLQLHLLRLLFQLHVDLPPSVQKHCSNELGRWINLMLVLIDFALQLLFLGRS